MAEFCTECTKELFGEVDSDFAGILSEEEFKKGQILSVLCEGCGYIYVNHLGERIDEEKEIGKFYRFKFIRKEGSNDF